MGVRVYDTATQKVVELDPASAKAAIANGSAQLLASEKLHVTMPGTLRTGTISADALAAAEAEGWELSDPERNSQRRLKREESDAASTAVAGVEAILSGPTMDLLRPLEVALGADPERVAARREMLGAGATALEVGGAVLGGGAGLAAKSTAGALRGGLAGLAARGARGIEGVVGRALPAAIPKAVSSAVPTAAGQFAEGVGYMTGAELSESVLGQREMSRDNILAGGLMAGALGGTLGLVVPGVSKLAAGVGRAPAEAVDSVLRRWTGDASGAAGQPSAMAKAMSVGSGGGDARLIQEGFDLAKTRRGRDMLLMGKHEHAAEVQGLAREVGESVDPLNDAVTRGIIESEGASYMRGVELPRNADLIAPRVTNTVLTDMEGAVEKLMVRAERAQDSNAIGMLDDAREALAGGRALLEDAQSKAIDVMRRSDQIQRRLQQITQKAQATGARGYVTDEVISGLRTVRESMSTHLKNKEVWGKAAVRQAEGDALQAAAMNARREATGGKKNAVHRVLDRRQPTTDEDLLTMARKFGKGDLDNDAMEVFRREIDYMEWLAKNHDGLSPQFHAALKEAKAGLPKLEAAIAHNAERLHSADVMNRLRSWESGDSVSIGVTSNLGTTAGAFLGGAIAGPIGAAVGAWAGRAISSPYTTIRTLAGMMHLAEKAGLQVDGAVGRFLAKTRRSDAKPTTAIAKRERQPSRAAARAATVVASRSLAERKTEADQIRKRAATLATDPDLLLRELQAPLYFADHHAPGLTDQLRMQVQTAADFLQSKAPSVYQAPMSASPPRTNPFEQAKYERYVEAVLRPLEVLDRLADGGLTLEHVEAIRVVYPDIYARVRTSVMEEVAAAAAEGRPIPFRQRIQIGQLFDLPTDVSQNPAFFLATQTPTPSEDLVPAPPTTKLSDRTNATGSTTPAQRTEV